MDMNLKNGMDYKKGSDYILSETLITNPYTFILDKNYIFRAETIEKYNYDGKYGPIPDEKTGIVDLSNYAKKYIEDYLNVTEIPEENKKYLNSGLITNNVNNMFNDCRNIQEIDLSNVQILDVKQFYSVFNRCYKVKYINISNLDSSKSNDFRYAFSGCFELLTIEGIIDMYSCDDAINMFVMDSKLTGVKIKNPSINFDSSSGLNSNQYVIVS